MNTNLLQLSRIDRCYRFIARHHAEVELEVVAREWIVRYARHWRSRYKRAHP